MIPRSSRLALWCLALLLSVSLYVKGRVTAGKGEGAALLRAGPGAVKVRLAGDFPHPGVYTFPDGVSVASAIKMTLPGSRISERLAAQGGAPIRNGDILTLRLASGEPPVLSLGRMGVRERMLLRIALDPDRLSEEEWSALPGIGPVLAGRIAADRQKNGAFGGIEGLLRVPGLGPGRLAALKRYF